MDEQALEPTTADEGEAVSMPPATAAPMPSGAAGAVDGAAGARSAVDGVAGSVGGAAGARSAVDGAVGSVGGPAGSVGGPATEAVAAGSSPAVAPTDDGDLSLLALIDRLADLLGRSDLTELEVEAGATGLVLRKPGALAPMVVAASAAGAVGAAGTSASGGIAGDGAADPAGLATAPPRPAVKAPLTGIFYTSPSPGAPAYVQVGGEVAVGQVIGLIEAMKLFNEIKSDLAGRVVRFAAENGSLVKAKQPLIEVEPL